MAREPFGSGMNDKAAVPYVRPVVDLVFGEVP